MSTRITRPVTAPVVAAFLFVVVGWLTFGVNWRGVAPDWYPLVRPFVPPLQVAVLGPLLVGSAFLTLRNGPRAVGAVLVGAGMLAGIAAVGRFHCLELGGAYGVPLHPVDYDGNVLRFGYAHRCRADPSELGLLGAWGVASLGVALLSAPDDVRFDRWRSSLRSDSEQ